MPKIDSLIQLFSQNLSENAEQKPSSFFDNRFEVRV